MSTASALEQVTGTRSPTARLVTRLAERLGTVSRRGFLLRTAVVGSALAVDPKGFVLTPTSAYASVCGPAAGRSSGYTVFCCTVNNGVNACPPGTFTAGWWKAADSSWCCGGYRYIVDCNATCRSCTSGCAGDHICDSRCWSCSCERGSTATCDQRRDCCNAFRYGQCNTHVRCSGGVACRVVSCVPPYRWDSCTTTALVDNTTSEHSAPCVQGCGDILKAYDRMGANGSVLGASTGPERAVGDGRGRYVTYQHGAIYWTSATGAHAVRGGIGAVFLGHGAREVLGYPVGEEVDAAGGGRHQEFERGSIYWKRGPGAQAVRGSVRSRWLGLGGSASVLGFPIGPLRAAPAGALVQDFERGSVYAPPQGAAQPVRGTVRTRWLALGGPTSPLGLPQDDEVASGAGTWQQFAGGLMAWSRPTSAWPLLGAFATRWRDELGAGAAAPGFPTAAARPGRDGRGAGQPFTGGELWVLDAGPARLLTGPVLAAWQGADAEAGHWGYPLSDVGPDGAGGQQATFEGGVLVVAAGG